MLLEITVELQYSKDKVVYYNHYHLILTIRSQHGKYNHNDVMRNAELMAIQESIS